MDKSIFYDNNQYNFGRIALLFFVLLAIAFGGLSFGLMITHYTEGIWVMFAALSCSLIGLGYYADQYTVVTDSSIAIEQFKHKNCYAELEEFVASMKRPLTYEELRRVSHLV